MTENVGLLSKPSLLFVSLSLRPVSPCKHHLQFVIGCSVFLLDFVSFCSGIQQRCFKICFKKSYFSALASKLNTSFDQQRLIWYVFRLPCKIWCTIKNKQARHSQTPPGSETFPLCPCGPISFLELALRRYYSGYLLEHFNVSHSALVDQNHVLCHFYWLCELLRASNAVFMIEAEFPGVCVYMSNVLWKKTHSFWVVLC